MKNKDDGKLTNRERQSFSNLILSIVSSHLIRLVFRFQFLHQIREKQWSLIFFNTYIDSLFEGKRSSADDASSKANANDTKCKN